MHEKGSGRSTETLRNQRQGTQQRNPCPALSIFGFPADNHLPHTHLRRLISDNVPHNLPAHMRGLAVLDSTSDEETLAII